MSTRDRLDSIRDLLQGAADLEKAIREGIQDENTPNERTRRRAHRLRETLGVALVLSERLTREFGNGEMVRLEPSDEGTGQASFSIVLDDRPYFPS